MKLNSREISEIACMTMSFMLTSTTTMLGFTSSDEAVMGFFSNSPFYWLNPWQGKTFIIFFPLILFIIIVYEIQRKDELEDECGKLRAKLEELQK